MLRAVLGRKACRTTLPTNRRAVALSALQPADVQAAREQCLSILRTFDAPSFTLLPFIPSDAQTAYVAIRAFNVETARVADAVSTAQVGTMRLQFWRDNVNKALAGSPSQHPVPELLAAASADLDVRSAGQARLSPLWFSRIIEAREAHLNNEAYATLEACERYAENTYSTLLYLTLQALPIASTTVDHIASHIGKAAGIVALLRGLPLLAFPPAPNHHSNTAGLDGSSIQQRQRSQHGTVLLPLDVMARAGLREEDVFRKGSEAPGLKDAVFEVATRANDHLITARTMVDNLRQGQDVDHAFEHADEVGHNTTQGLGPSSEQLKAYESAFGPLMPAVSSQLWLEKLQKLDFDIFRDELRRRDWKLPWRAYRAFAKKTL